MKNVKHAKCVRCGRIYAAAPDLTSCACGGILDIVYDYDYIRSVFTKDDLAQRRDSTMWRFRELLPVEEDTPLPPLRVGGSPLYEADALAQELGLAKLYIKDDGINPTASLKDRASAMAVAKAREAGAQVIACSSTGNAAINPYLSEGKKTVGLEIMEQLNWAAPDYIAISVGDGCTIAGLWKGLKDLHAIGFIDRLPRLISVQAEGCCPLNRAIETGEDWRPMEENTLADSIAVGVPRNADKALMAIRESNGLTVNVSDQEIMAAQKLLGRRCGVFGEPAGVTGTAGLKKLCQAGRIPSDAVVVSVVTGSGLKDVANAIAACGEPISIPGDMALLEAAFRQAGIRA